MAEGGIILYGVEPSIISNVSIEGLDFLIKNGPLQKTYGGNFDLRPTADLSLSLFSHDIPGIFIKNVAGLKITNSKIQFEEKMEDFFKYVIWAEDFQNFEITGLTAAPPNASKEALIYLKNGKDFSLENSNVYALEKSFLKKTNGSGNIHLFNNRFKLK